MYCTLQEAYNVPSFAAKRKKSDLNPLNTSRNLLQCAPTASAEPYDPFDGENSRGEQSIYTQTNPYANSPNNSRSSQVNPSSSSTTKEGFAYSSEDPIAVPPPGSCSTGRLSSQKYINSPYTSQANPSSAVGTIKEGFMCPSDDPSAPPPGSCSTGRPSFQKYSNSPYTSQANDYKHYCNYYNICTDTIPYSDANIIEKFSTQKQQQQQQQPQNQAQCKPVQAPMYEIPVSDAAKQQYKTALSVAMQDNNPSSTLPYTIAPSQMRAVDMSKVRGLYDDEIEAYMHVESENNYGGSQVPHISMPQSQPVQSYPQQTNTPSQFPKQNSVAAFDPADATPFSKAIANFSAEKGRPVLHPEFGLSKHGYYTSSNNNIKNNWQFICDLILFISAGILIILLCEMLFKIAISIGTRDTMSIIEPYLAELAELRLRIAEVGKERVSVLEV